MEILSKTLKFCNFQLLRLSWLLLVVLLFLHFFLSWLALMAVGEKSLIVPVDWIYFYVTTATTIGYGDLSPNTSIGRLVTAIFIMPCAVVLFAAFLGKLSSLFISIWRKGVQGEVDYSQLQDHTVILGWHPEKTSRMVELIFGDLRRQEGAVVLCADQNMENPFPDNVRFVQGDRLLDYDVFHRSGIEQASRIIIFQESDDKTLAACLSVCTTETKAHIVAWFEHHRMACLVQTHCPQVECHTNISVDLLVRSAQDPGSSRLQSQLLSTLEGQTQFSVQVPDHFSGTTFGCLLKIMKQKHEAIVLGIADTKTGNDLLLNPPVGQRVKAGQLVYFMAAERIKESEVVWGEMAD